MKKILFSITILLCCAAAFSGCIKHATNLTINPTMTASVDATNTFTAATVVPSTIINQIVDTGTILTITGNANLLQGTPGDQIILQLAKYKGLTGTFSIVGTQAGAAYIHGNGIVSIATGGIVSITNITSNTIIGYFSFTTADGHTISNGAFTVGKP